MSDFIENNAKRFVHNSEHHKSRRQFCKTTLAGSVALAFGQGARQAIASESACGAKTSEQGFASTFVNVPEEFPPTRVKFNKPLPEGLSGTLYRNGPARMQRGDTRLS